MTLNEWKATALYFLAIINPVTSLMISLLILTAGDNQLKGGSKVAKKSIKISLIVIYIELIAFIIVLVLSILLTLIYAASIMLTSLF